MPAAPAAPAPAAPAAPRTAPHSWEARAPIGPPRTPEIRPAEPRVRPSQVNATPASIATMLPEGLTRPSASRPSARPGAPAKPATPAMPPRTFESPLAAWKALIKETARPLLEDAAFLGVADGFVQLAIRHEGSRFRVEGSLLGLDLRPWFPLCQGARLIVDAGIGQTGWERRSTRDRERREGAISAAQTSEAIRLLTESLGALLIVPDIEPPELPAEEVIEEEG